MIMWGISNKVSFFVKTLFLQGFLESFKDLHPIFCSFLSNLVILI